MIKQFLISAKQFYWKLQNFTLLQYKSPAN